MRSSRSASGCWSCLRGATHQSSGRARRGLMTEAAKSSSKTSRFRGAALVGARRAASCGPGRASDANALASKPDASQRQRDEACRVPSISCVPGLADWETTEVIGSTGTRLRITATPGRHGPPLRLPFVGKGDRRAARGRAPVRDQQIARAGSSRASRLSWRSSRVSRGRRRSRGRRSDRRRAQRARAGIDPAWRPRPAHRTFRKSRASERVRSAAPTACPRRA